MKKNCIYHADVLRGLAEIEDRSIHCAITSPPYNLEKPYGGHEDNLDDTEYLAWMETVWRETLRTLVSGGRLCINIGENKRQNISMPHYVAFAQQLCSMGALYRGTVIWNKHSAANHCAWGSWKRCSNPHVVPRHEYILIFSKDQWKLEGEKSLSDMTSEEFMLYTRSVWEFAPERKSRVGHPAPFPKALPERLIKFLTYRGNLVLDMFGGSGTVGVAAATLGRDFILIDNCLEYCNLAAGRIGSEAPMFIGGPSIINLDGV
jgi:modification methylase